MSQKDSKKIACIFPGIGYTCDKPLLYYSEKLLRALNWDIVRVQYHDLPEKVRGDQEKMHASINLTWEQTKEKLQEIDWTSYSRILFISKSIGTIIAAKYAYENNIKSVRHVLYTPLEETYIYPTKESIAFVGTKDMMYDKVVGLSGNAGIPLFVFDDCNHSLETDNVIHNIEIINKIMIKTKEFISKVN